MRSFKMPMRVVFYREDGRLFAHALEFGVLGDGPDHRSALQSLMDAIAAQVHTVSEHGNPANLFSPAEPRIFEMFALGHDVFTGQLEIDEKCIRTIDGLTVQGVQVREYEPDPIPAA